MKETNEPKSEALDDRIDRNLRDAHQRIQVRPDWAESVLREITNESGRRTVKPSSSVAEFSSRPWQWVATLATGLLIAISGTAWMALRSKIRESTETDEVTVKSMPQDELRIERQQDARPLTRVSVGAVPGYLASKLADDPEFEIYVVLPSRKTVGSN